MPRLKGFRFPREIITYDVWADHRFALSTVDVEDLLAERGVIVSRESVRRWVNRFGRHFADCIKRDRPRPRDKWHLDEVVIMIAAANTGSGRRSTRQEMSSTFRCSRAATRRQQSGSCAG